MASPLAGEPGIIDIVFERLPIAAAILDSGYTVVRANPAFDRVRSLLDSAKCPVAGLPVMSPRTPGIDRGWCEGPLAGPDGSSHWLRTRLTPLIGQPDRNSTWLLLVEEQPSAEDRIATGMAEMSAARTRFLTGAGHDLRQPLNALSLFLGVLKASKNHDHALDIASRMQTTLEMVVSLFNGILVMAKLETGAVSVNPQPVEAERIIETLLTEFEDVATAKGLSFRVAPTAELIRADNDLLKVVLRTFLTNAIHYTTQGGVLLGCRRRSHALRFDVFDTGPGIPDAEIPQIFEAFQRGRHHGQGASSYGIGLALASSAAKQLGSPLEVDSRFGRGSRFSVYVPLA